MTSDIAGDMKDSLPSGARPGGKGIARRNHNAPLIPWAGRAKRLNQVLGSIPCRDDPAGSPKARCILRKLGEAYG